jgi:hypothetical protein
MDESQKEQAGAGEEDLCLLTIGEHESWLVQGRQEPLRLAMGYRALVPGQTLGQFHREPPSPLELEQAIAWVEDIVMPLATDLAPCSALRLGPSPLTPLFGPVTLPLARIEQSFAQLAAMAERDPLAARDLPAGREFAATLLILREFMHHLGFIEVSLLAAQP